MTKSKAPVSSFGPELQNALRAGSDSELHLVFDTPALATRFNARINSLRSAMRREKHPDSDRLYRAGVYISRENPCCVIISPKDSEFRKALAEAKIPTALPPPATSISIPTPRPGTEEDPANSFLASLTEATTVPPRSGSAIVDPEED